MNRKLFGGVLLGIAVIAGGMGIRGLLLEEAAGNSYEGLQEEVKAETAEAPAPEPEEVLTGEKLPDIPIDFEKVMAECPDAYAWIRIPDTNIDYPIVQSPDNDSFYLDHNARREAEYAGAIYTESLNKKDFSDPNTVIYGHNMANGSMFQNLHLYEDRTFMEQHPEFEIYTPTRIYRYRVFAAYNYDDRHLLKSFDFSDRMIFRFYLQEVLRQRAMDANIDKDVEVRDSDRIVTLSTCNNYDDQRYLVQGVLLSE